MKKKNMSWHEKKHYNSWKYEYGNMLKDVVMSGLLIFAFTFINTNLLKHNIIPDQYIQLYCGAGAMFNVMLFLAIFILWRRMLSFEHHHI